MTVRATKYFGWPAGFAMARLKRSSVASTFTFSARLAGGIRDGAIETQGNPVDADHYAEEGWPAGFAMARLKR